jgi:hypothetical protein
MIGLNYSLQTLSRLPKAQEEIIASIVNQWMEKNLEHPKVHPRSWYEGTVTKRVSTLVNLLNYIRRHGEIPGLDTDLIIKALVLHSEYLLLDNVYVTGNHGVRQDIALLAIASAIPQLKKRDLMISTALTRTNQTAEKFFSADGIWREHAPGYISYVVWLLKSLEEQIVTSGADARKFLILKHIDSSLDYLVNIVAPDGTIPLVGRSPATHAEGSKEIELATQGKWPFPEKTLVGKAFVNYGHVVIREGGGNSREVYRDSFYLFANAAQNLPGLKRHADELSFLIYNLGRWWLIDPGHYTYENKPMRPYFGKPNAHGGYMVGEKYVESQAKPELKAGIIEAKIDQPVAKVRMFSDRFRNGERVEREILVNRSDLSVQVLDTLVPRSEKTKDWTGYLQLAHDLEVTKIVNGVTAIDEASDNKLTICFDPKKVRSYSFVKGTEKPAQGWRIYDRKLIPSWSIIFKPYGNDMKMVLSWDKNIKSCSEVIH